MVSVVGTMAVSVIFFFSFAFGTKYFLQKHGTTKRQGAGRARLAAGCVLLTRVKQRRMLFQHGAESPVPA